MILLFENLREIYITPSNTFQNNKIELHYTKTKGKLFSLLRYIYIYIYIT